MDRTPAGERTSFHHLRMGPIRSTLPTIDSSAPRIRHIAQVERGRNAFERNGRMRFLRLDLRDATQKARQDESTYPNRKSLQRMNP
jgi:hypothetical protein